MFELKIITRFAAAHQLTLMGTKCENLHGHNWKIEVVLTGNELDKAGVLMDFSIIKKKVAGIMDELDHKFLNELEDFKKLGPSSENIAMIVAKKLGKEIDNDKVKVKSVCAWESDDACATYFA